MIERLSGYAESKELSFGNIDCRKAFNFSCITVAMVRRLVIDGHQHAVAHEVDVATDGLGADFEFSCQRAAIGEPAFFQSMVDKKHPFNGGAFEAMYFRIHPWVLALVDKGLEFNV